MSILDLSIGLIGVILVCLIGWKLIGRIFIVERQYANAAGAAEYFNHLKRVQKLTPINSSVLLGSGETAFFEAPAELCEMKPQLLFATPTLIDLGKDTFTAKPRLKVSTESGVLVLTDKRLIFIDGLEACLLELKDIVLVRAWSDSVELKVSRSTDRPFYRVENPIIWCKLIDGMVTGNLQSFIDRGLDPASPHHQICDLSGLEAER